jgi:hypothetical protein
MVSKSANRPAGDRAAAGTLGTDNIQSSTENCQSAQADEYSETCSKKGRGKAKRSLDLIEAMHDIAEAAEPITGRGVGYKLFTAGLIPSMARSEMQRILLMKRDADASDNREPFQRTMTKPTPSY